MIQGLLTVLLTATASQPSFDCTRATAAIEQEICGSQELGRLDRELAEAYERARRRLSPNAHASLRRDQRWFLGARDEAFETRGEPAMEGFADLAERLRERVLFLDSIEAGRSDWTGRWANLAGHVVIRAVGRGAYRVALAGIHPVNGRWLCETELVATGDGSRLSGVSIEDPAFRITLERRGGVISVTETRIDDGIGGPAYCGFNGFVAGDYFPVTGG